MLESALWGVSAPEGGVCSGGVSAPEGSALGGCLLPGRGVCSGGGCLLPGGVCSQGGLLPGGICSRGVSAPGGCVPEYTEADPPVDRHTFVKILPWPNFVAAGNKRKEMPTLIKEKLESNNFRQNESSNKHQ